MNAWRQEDRGAVWECVWGDKMQDERLLFSWGFYLDSDRTLIARTAGVDTQCNYGGVHIMLLRIQVIYT